MRSLTWSNCWACRMEMPGSVVGMYRIEPSSSGGMASDPSCVNTGMVTSTTAAAAPITSHFQRSVQRTTGS